MKCAYCGVEEALPYQCHSCGAYFCSQHRLPENHKCSGTPKRVGGPIITSHTIKKVKLRNGRIVRFSPKRITNAIFRKTRNRKTARELSDEVVSILNQRYAGRIPTTKEIHHIVKRVLTEHRKQKKSRIGLELHKFAPVLKKKWTIVLLAVLVMVSIWAWFLLSSPSVQLQAYQQFLGWAPLIFFIAFGLGIVVAAPKPKKTPRKNYRRNRS